MSGSVANDGYPGMTQIFNRVRVMGMTSRPSAVTVEGQPWPDYTYNDSTKVSVHVTRQSILQCNDVCR